jgi:hypothetical protein
MNHDGTGYNVNTSINQLVSAIHQNQVDCLVQEFDFDTGRQNQMLFIVKPGVFLIQDPKLIEETCRFMGERIDAFGLETRGCYVMSAETLKANEIMDRHYGYINRLSRTASSLLSIIEKAEVRKLCSASDSTPVLGGHEVLAKFRDLSAQALDEIWASKKSLRVRSGLYVQSYDISGEALVIANGFHPFQLERFTGSGRKIALLLLSSDLPWKLLRVRMLGDTFPERAAPGSIRGEMHRDPERFGFKSVTISNNAAHLSAGPFEAVFELSNFLSAVPGLNFEIGITRQAQHFKSQGLSVSDLRRAIDNPSACIANAKPAIPLFDATEEFDAQSGTAVFRKFFF